MDLPAKLKDAYRSQRQRHERAQNHRAKQCHRKGKRARKGEKTHLDVLGILEHKHQDDG